MRLSSIFILAVSLAIGSILLLGGCDEYHASEDAPQTREAQPGPPGTEGRKSTLGKAMDAGERTRGRMDDYQDRVAEEADQVFDR